MLCMFLLQELYPVNQLRNLALENVRTSHVLLTDIDFIPSKELYSSSLRLSPMMRPKMVRSIYCLYITKMCNWDVTLEKLWFGPVTRTQLQIMRMLM